MASRAAINEFLSHHNLALVRLSRASPVRGVRIDKELGSKGYAVSVAYLDDPDPGSKLRGLTNPVDGVILAVPSAQAERAVLEAVDAKVPRIWLQKGCESKAAVAACEKNRVPVVHGECVLMYTEPVTSVHAFHRWLAKLFGALAK
jgi:hypothetical protein